ncbi:MAG: hypothetical protein OXN94_14350 [Chloroflexota bacterium]|nr:hypothetical protein [Chloroflexota bacterium]
MRKTTLLILFALAISITGNVSAQDWRKIGEDGPSVNCNLLHTILHEFGEFNFFRDDEEVYDLEYTLSRAFDVCFLSDDPLYGYTKLTSPGEYDVSDVCAASFRTRYDDPADTRIIAIVLGNTAIQHDLFDPQTSKRLQADSGFVTEDMKNLIYFTDGYVEGEYKLHLIYEGNLYGLIFSVNSHDSYFFHFDCPI